jgi:hypothetical protein
MRKIFTVISFIVCLFSAEAKSLNGYLTAKKDTNYIENYYNDLIIRLYSGEKTHSLDLNDLNSPYHLKYLPNGYFNLGAGVNFRSFGLSLATKVPIFQNSEIKHGETKRFGIQSYIYSSKFTVDLLTSFLKGYYLVNTSSHLNSYSKDKDYQRPDISSANIGISVNYIFNHSHFSYRAAFNDTERQKKSAGSLIAGGSIISYQTKADSSIVPREIDAKYFLKSRDISKSGVLAFNANIGYAYSLVFLKNGIFTLSYILGTGIQDNSFGREVDSEINRWRFSVNHSARIGIGYRFNWYYLRLGIIRSTQYTNLNYNDLGIRNGTNFIQISLGKRFSIKNLLKK